MEEEKKRKPDRINLAHFFPSLLSSLPLEWAGPTQPPVGAAQHQPARVVVDRSAQHREPAFDRSFYINSRTASFLVFYPNPNSFISTFKLRRLILAPSPLLYISSRSFHADESHYFSSPRAGVFRVSRFQI